MEEEDGASREGIGERETRGDKKIRLIIDVLARVGDMASYPKEGDLPPSQPSASQPSASQPSAGNSPPASNSSDALDLDQIISSDEETERPRRDLPHIVEWYEKMKKIVVEIDAKLTNIASWITNIASWMHVVPMDKKEINWRIHELVTAMVLLKSEGEYDINQEAPFGVWRRESKHEILQMKWVRLQDDYLEIKKCVEGFQNTQVDHNDDGEPTAKRARRSHEPM